MSGTLWSAVFGLDTVVQSLLVTGRVLGLSPWRQQGRDSLILEQEELEEQEEEEE